MIKSKELTYKKFKAKVNFDFGGCFVMSVCQKEGGGGGCKGSVTTTSSINTDQNTELPYTVAVICQVDFSGILKTTSSLQALAALLHRTQT